MKKIKYPIGQQDFRNLREMGCVYVDKTLYIEKVLIPYYVKVRRGMPESVVSQTATRCIEDWKVQG